MRDFPMFTTENGVGSITLKEVTYKGIAYIKIQSSLLPEAFLQECIDFCKMAGAEKIYASGHKMLETYPLHNAIWLMSALRERLQETDAALFPVTEKTADTWRSIYNENVPHFQFFYHDPQRYGYVGSAGRWLFYPQGG